MNGDDGIRRERLAQAIQDKGISLAELGRRVGVHRSTVSSWLAGGRGRPSARMCISLGGELAVRADWLLDMGEIRELFPLTKPRAGADPQKIVRAPRDRTSSDPPKRKDSALVPLAGAAAAGEAMAKIYESQDVQWFDFPMEFLRAIYKTAPDPERAIVMRVEGDSMAGELPHHSFVFIDRGPGGEGWPREKIREDDIYMVRPPGEEGLTLKRVTIDDGWIHLSPTPGSGHKVRAFRIKPDTKIQSIVRGRVVGKIERI